MSLSKPVFHLADEYKQIALDLDLPEVESDGVSVEEARIRSEAGRKALQILKGTQEQPAWFERFEMLINGGWPWRQAVYIAWASMPKEGRKPETQDELARQVLGLTSDRAISTWRNKNAAIETMIRVMQSAELWEYRADWFNNLVKGMMRAGDDYKFFNHLKLFGEVMGDYVPLTQLAAVLKRKADGSPTEADEETLKLLEQGAKEMPTDFNPTPDPSPNSGEFGEGGDIE
jgi:hypothetical protein